PEAREALARLVAAIVAAGAVPVVHVCAADVPVALLAQVGFSAVSFDLSQVTPGEPWALAYEGGIALWPGAVPAMDPDQPPTASALVAAVLRFFAELGVTEEQVADRLVVTPACGLAGASPTWARDALRLSREVAAMVARS
ncbi:MAG: methionine synthase, partial [Actinomycetota bacterium]|nr:methionine synthase [Actinomycetota bacterium]